MARRSNFSRYSRTSRVSRYSRRRAPRGRSATSQVEQLARQMANQIIREREQAKARQRLGRIFTDFDATDDILPNNIELRKKHIFKKFLVLVILKKILMLIVNYR